MNTNDKERKATPIYTGFIKYFPLAVKEIAKASVIGNTQHKNGDVLHWDRSKSKDELDSMMRHLVDHADGEEFDTDGVRHSTKVAWRALANLQKEIEKARENEI